MYNMLKGGKLTDLDGFNGIFNYGQDMLVSFLDCILWPLVCLPWKRRPSGEKVLTPRSVYEHHVIQTSMLEQGKLRHTVFRSG